MFCTFFRWKNLFFLFPLFLFPAYLFAASHLQAIPLEDPFTAPIDFWKQMYGEFERKEIGSSSHFNDDGTVSFYDPAVVGLAGRRPINVLFSERADKNLLCKWLVSSSQNTSQISLSDVKAHRKVETTLHTPDLYSQDHLAALDAELSPYVFKSTWLRISQITCQISKQTPPMSRHYQEIVESEDQKTVRLIKPRFRLNGVKRRFSTLSSKDQLCQHYGYRSYVQNSMMTKTLGVKYRRKIVKMDRNRLCSQTLSAYSDTYIKEISCHMNEINEQE